MAFPIVIVGTLAFLAIGLLVGAVAKTVEAASAMANLVVLPMAFLSGHSFRSTMRRAGFRRSPTHCR